MRRPKTARELRVRATILGGLLGGPLFLGALQDAEGAPETGDTESARAQPARFVRSLIAAALERTRHSVTYDGRYLALDYPGGDVPESIGVCTDVVIRAYRALGIDLQERVHEDMRADFGAYPKMWGLSKPDSNIDHRRVPNLRVFLSRHGKSLVPTRNPEHYRPGDLVTWMLNRRLPHIGIVVDGRSADGTRPLVVHNVGLGPRREDVLFAYPITGHYRYGTDPGSGLPTRSQHAPSQSETASASDPDSDANQDLN